MHLFITRRAPRPRHRSTSAFNVQRSALSVRARSPAGDLLAFRFVEPPARRGAAWRRSPEERARRSRSTSSQLLQARGEGTPQGTPPTRGTGLVYALVYYAPGATAAALFHFGVRRSTFSVKR